MLRFPTSFFCPPSNSLPFSSWSFLTHCSFITLFVVYVFRTIPLQTFQLEHFFPFNVWIVLTSMHFFFLIFGCIKSQFAAHRIFSCSMWDLVPRPGIELQPPALGGWNLSHWTNWEVPHQCISTQRIQHI